MIRTFCFLALSLLVLPGNSAFAQGVFAGQVVDPQGAVVTGATVTLASEGAPPRSTSSDDQGQFRFADVVEGAYTLQVAAPGFMDATTAVRVARSPQRVTVTLTIAGVAQDVTVLGTVIGTAATGKTTVPLRDLPLTIDGVTRAQLDDQGTNDLVTALKSVPAVYPFTTYGVYEYYSFRGFLDSVQLVDGVRQEGNRVNTQLTNVERIEVLKDRRPRSTAAMPWARP